MLWWFLYNRDGQPLVIGDRFKYLATYGHGYTMSEVIMRDATENVGIIAYRENYR